ncbi:hypothetical protein [Teredinibacter haidensis]|uniref:hypothetical protein n=1 Tax=Teredinibacter haidensis TaxID=2731755 RepID=UPI001587FAAA|nr:hypothetical protein [Teredinibacter haidensis]
MFISIGPMKLVKDCVGEDNSSTQLHALSTLYSKNKTAVYFLDETILKNLDTTARR